MPNIPLDLDLITGLAGFILTLMVLSYLIGDNPLFRFANYLFVGVSAGYVALVVWSQVLVPGLFEPLFSKAWPERGLYLIPLFLFVLMLMKVSPRLAWLGGPSIGYVAGVGAAVAVGGAIFGTLFPQVMASAEPFDTRSGSLLDALMNGSILNGLILLLGTVTTLAYFHFGARRKTDGSVRRNGLVNTIAWIGQIFVAVTFGALFAGVYSAALTALIERISSLINLFLF
jgi:hypothetical protein